VAQLGETVAKIGQGLGEVRAVATGVGSSQFAPNGNSFLLGEDSVGAAQIEAAKAEVV
jgi:hypothetical protein